MMAAPMESMDSSKRVSKKLKHNIRPKSDESPPNKKPKLIVFNEIEFKVLLKDNSSKLLAIEKFNGECSLWPDETSCDIIARFCATSPQCTEIVQLLEQRDRKPAEVAMICEALERILMRITDDLSKYEMIGQNIVRQLLAAHLGAIYSLLFMRNKAGHIKASLKLLIAMVMQGEAAAREVMLQFDFQNNVLFPLLSRRDRKDPREVRTCYLHFMMAFLMTGDSTIIRQLVEMKGFLNGLFLGLLSDKFTTLQLVLPTLLDKIVQNPSIPKTSKIRLFNEAALRQLAELYRWTGLADWRDDSQGKRSVASPDVMIEESERTDEQTDVRDMIQNLLHHLCCSTKHGINFWDRTCATSGKNQNHVLTKLLTCLQKSYTEGLESSLMCDIMKVCPDQIHWFLPSMKNSISPRPAPAWVKSMDFLYQIYSNQADVSVSMVTQQSITTSKMVGIVMNMLFPPKDVWLALTSAVKKDNLIVRHYGVKLCLVVTKRVARTLAYCHDNHTQLPDGFVTSLTDVIVKTLPSIEVLYNCWRSSIKPKSDKQKDKDKPKDKDKADHRSEDKALPSVSLAHHLQLILQLLCCYQDALPLQFRDHHIDYNSLLEGVRVARQCTEEPDSDSLSLLQLHLIRLLVETDVRQFNWTKENVGGRTTLYLLLEMVISTRDNEQTNSIVRQLVHKLFLRTGYFQSAESEVALWLQKLTLSLSPNEVISFLDRAIGQLLRTPYTFLDKLIDNAAMADHIDTHGDGETMETTSMGNMEALLESIVSMDEVELLDEESQDDKSVGGSTCTATPSTSVSSYSFSPLVPAVLDTAKKMDISHPDVLRYIEEVICQILHRQGNPVPLCHLVNTHEVYPDLPRLHASVDRWLGRTSKKKKTKSPKKVKPDAMTPLDQTQTLSEALRSCFELDVYNSQMEQDILELATVAPLVDAVGITRQLLLYLNTAVMEYRQNVTRTTEMIEFYGPVMTRIVDCVIERKDAPVAPPGQEGNDSPVAPPGQEGNDSPVAPPGQERNDSPVAPPDQEGNDSPVAPPGQEGNDSLVAPPIHSPNTGGISSDFSMLRVHDLEADEVLKEMFSIILEHEMLRKYFIEPALGSGRIEEITDIISRLIGQVVAKIPESMDVSTQIRPYLDKIATRLDKNLDDLLTERFLKTLAGFVKLISSADLNKLTLTLLNSEDVKQYFRDPQEGSTLGVHILSIMEELSSGKRLSQHGVSLPVVSCLATTAIKSANQKLLGTLMMILQSAPTYAIAISKDTFDWLLRCKEMDCDLLIRILLSNELEHRHWFREWLDISKVMSKKQAKWRVAGYIQHYLRGSSAVQGDVSEVRVVCDNYWSPLCDWLIRGDNEKKNMTRITLLCDIIQLSTNTDLLTRLVRDITSETLTEGGVNVDDIHNKMTALRHLLDKIQTMTGDTDEATNITDDISNMTDETDGKNDMEALTQCCVIFAVRCLMRVLADKKTRDSDIQTLVIDNLSLWSQKLTASHLSGLEDSWKSFVIKGLRKLYKRAEYLGVLCKLLPKIYSNTPGQGQPSSDRLQVTDIHTMLLSHSQFMATILEPGQTPCKVALVDLMMILSDLDPSCCQTSHISLLFGAYGATLNVIDQKLLLLLSKYERSDCQLTSVRPYLWGSAAIDYHSMKVNVGPSLYKAASMEQVLDLLDKDKLYSSALKFPLLRKTQFDIQDAASLRSDLDLYDPCFLLPVFSHLLGPENLVNCSKFVEYGCFSYTLAALSCHDDVIRASAYHVMARYRVHLEGHRQFRERYQILYITSLIRNSVERVNTKLPCVVTVFLAKAAQLMLKPGDHMYQMVNSFLLLKPALDVGHVPEFYMLFNSSAFEFKAERSWMLALLEEGLRETQDYHIYQRRHILRIVLSFYESAISDHHTQVQVLRLVLQACRVKSIISSMVKQHGLLQWIGMAIQSGSSDPVKCSHLVDIIHTMWFTLLGDRDDRRNDIRLMNSTASDLGDDATKHHCLPVLFTNQIMLILLDLILRTRNIRLETFDRLLNCLLSVCLHAKKTEQMYGSGHHGDVVSAHLSLEHVLSLLSQWAQLSKDAELLLEVDKIQGHRRLIHSAKSQSHRRSDNSDKTQGHGKSDRSRRIEGKERTEKCDEESTLETNQRIQDELSSQCEEKLVDLVSCCRVDMDVGDEGGSDQLISDAATGSLLVLDWSLKTLDGRPEVHAEKGIVVWFLDLVLSDRVMIERLICGPVNVLQRLFSVYDGVMRGQAEMNPAEPHQRSQSDIKDVNILISGLNRIFIHVFRVLRSDSQLNVNKVCSDITQGLTGETHERVLRKINQYDLSDQDNIKIQNATMTYVKSVMLGDRDI